MPTTQVGAHIAYYDEYGRGHPLLLISGLGGTRFGWWKQVEPLSRAYHVINMDNRDAGDSAPGAGMYTIADMAADSAGVIRNLNLGLTHVMGISMGGFISLELAIRYPELVDKLTLVATSAGGPTHVNAAPEILALLARNDSEDVETRVRRTFSQIAGPGYMDAHPADLADIVRHAQLKPMSLESYQRQIGAVISHNVSDRLSRITAPTLVVHGDADPLVPYANGQYLAAHIAGARLLTYPGVGHLPPIEATERFNRDVAEFLG